MLEMELLEYYKKMCERNIVLDFQGAISQEILVGMAELIKSKFAHELRSTRVVKRIFSVFIEMAQNIAFYSNSRISLDNNTPDIGTGIIVVMEEADSYSITSGNQVANRMIPAITSHCNRINEMDKDELKQFYKTQIKAAREAGKKGAGV
ncbi:MAG: hypothetical protein GY765_27545, partial [bacterium]|nr:hypothetical protein [bacterium]